MSDEILDELLITREASDFSKEVSDVSGIDIEFVDSIHHILNDLTLKDLHHKVAYYHFHPVEYKELTTGKYNF